jgi:hypothetical protein
MRFRKNQYVGLDDAIIQTWNYIAHDILECDPDFDETNIEHVAEVVLDAGRLESFNNIEPSELLTFRAMPIKEQYEYAALILK